MSFLVDNFGLCERVLAAALGLTGDEVPSEMPVQLAEEIFGMEDQFVTELEASPAPFEIERRQSRAMNFVVKRGLIYIHVKSKPNVAIVVPPHFVTDFASVPAIFRGIAPFEGPASAPSVIHDWLYAIAEPPKNQTQFRIERARADRIYLEAMRTAGVGGLRRSLLYRGTRLFGQRAFGRREELRFVDPASPDRLLDTSKSDKQALRMLTILPRPQAAKKSFFSFLGGR